MGAENINFAHKVLQIEDFQHHIFFVFLEEHLPPSKNWEGRGQLPPALPATMLSVMHAMRSARVEYSCNTKQDHQALLKAECCTRVVAVSHTHRKTPKTHVTLTFDR